MARLQTGRWTEQFGANEPFANELARAVEISHAWNDIGTQVFVELERMPGWLRPLWAFHDGWLYLRRPEGVWKTKPPALLTELPIVLCQKPPEGKYLGSEYIGDRFLPTRGWMRGAGEATSPAEMDDELSAIGYGVAADEVGDGLTEVIEDTPARYLMAAGDLFDCPPAITVDGQWLVCADAASGRRAAYSLESDPHAKKALRDGRLWLRFGGPYLEPFAVKAAPL